ncbi:MAG: hypothetical protein ABIS67_02050 [Candidatus Eisenbacteria bacterium]
MKLSGRLLLPLIVMLSCSAPALAFEGGAWTVSPGEWYSEVSARRFYANSEFHADSRNGAIPGEGRFQEFQVASYNEIGWKKNISLMLGIPFITSTQRFGEKSRTISGLSDARIGLRLRMRNDLPGFIFDGGWQAPLGYNKNVGPRLGDGRQKFWGALHAGTRLPLIPGFVQASRGVFFISEDGELYSRTSVEAGAWIGRRVLLGGHYGDVVPINSANEVARLGTSYRAGPVVLIRLDDHLDLSIGGTRALFGRNSLETTQFQVALGFKQTKLNPLQGFLGTLQKP